MHPGNPLAVISLRLQGQTCDMWWNFVSAEEHHPDRHPETRAYWRRVRNGWTRRIGPRDPVDCGSIKLVLGSFI